MNITEQIIVFMHVIKSLTDSSSGFFVKYFIQGFSSHILNLKTIKVFNNDMITKLPCHSVL